MQKRIEILKIQDLFKLKIAKFIYKCLNKNTPINVQNWFTLATQTHNYNTRSKFIVSDQLVNTKHLFIPIAQTLHYGLKQIKVQGAKIWNDLPPYTRIITSLGSFNTKLYRHLVEKYKSKNLKFIKTKYPRGI